MNSLLVQVFAEEIDELIEDLGVNGILDWDLSLLLGSGVSFMSRIDHPPIQKMICDIVVFRRDQFLIHETIDRIEQESPRRLYIPSLTQELEQDFLSFLRDLTPRLSERITCTSPALLAGIVGTERSDSEWRMLQFACELIRKNHQYVHGHQLSIRISALDGFMHEFEHFCELKKQERAAPNLGHHLAMTAMVHGLISTIVTTNWDDCLESCMSDDLRQNIYVVSNMTHIPDQPTRTKWLFKIHGSINPIEEFVLFSGIDEYLQSREQKEALFSEAMRRLSASRAMAIVGFSGQYDEHIIRLLDSCAPADVTYVIVNPSKTPLKVRNLENNVFIPLPASMGLLCLILKMVERRIAEPRGAKHVVLNEIVSNGRWRDELISEIDDLENRVRRESRAPISRRDVQAEATFWQCYAWLLSIRELLSKSSSNTIVGGH